MSNFLNKSLAVKLKLCAAQQTRPKKRKQTKKSAKLKNQEGNTGQKSGPKTAALRCRANQTERKRQLAKLASKEAGRTHLAAETTAERREEKRREDKQTTSEKKFVNIHKRTSKTTHETHGHPTHRPPTWRQTATPPPPPPPKDPP